MPTVLRIHGLSCVICPNYHEPAHVHVLGAGWSVVVDLVALRVRTVVDCNLIQARRVLQIAELHRDALMEAWRRIHG